MKKASIILTVIIGVIIGILNPFKVAGPEKLIILINVASTLIAYFIIIFIVYLIKKIIKMTSHPLVEWNGKLYKISRIKKYTVTFTQLFYPFKSLEKIIMTEEEVSKFCEKNKNLLKLSITYFPIKKEGTYAVCESLNGRVLNTYPMTDYNHSNHFGCKVLTVVPQC